MGVLDVAVGRALKAIDQRALAEENYYRPGVGYGYVPLENHQFWTGNGVTADTSYNFITVYQCVRVLAETFASVPLIVYRRLPGGGKERAEDHELYPILHDRPNPDMTSFVWRELLMSHLATWGNAYNEIVLDQAGRLSLWPIRPDRVEASYNRDGRKTWWYLSPTGTRTEFAPGSILHVQGLSSDGLAGMSPIAVMRAALRLYKTAERFGTAFFDNDARPGTILSHPRTLSKPAIERLREQMESLKGANNSGKTIVVEEGLTVSEVGIHPEDAQFMETRTFQKREVTAAYRIPPHKVGDLERATFSNIEQQSIEFVQDTMLPWFVRTEQQLAADLMSAQDQKEFVIEFLVDGLLRGDSKARAEALAIRWQHGTINADEWRDKENENPLPDGAGKAYFVPVNYQPTASALAPAVEPAAAPEEDGGTSLTLVASRSLAQFDCPDCGKMINRLAVPGTIGYCKGCRAERTMAS